MSSASIPTSGDEITAEWIVQVLSNNLTSSSKVEVASFEVEDEDKKSGTLRLEMTDTLVGTESN